MKKEGGQHPAILTSRLVVNKGFVVWPEKELILAGPKWKIPSGQGGSILPAGVTNQSTGFPLSCLLFDSAIKYNFLIFVTVIFLHVILWGKHSNAMVS